MFYEICIIETDEADRFHIDWQWTMDGKQMQGERFTQSAKEIQEHLELEGSDLWIQSRDHRLELGRSIYRFLSGPNDYLTNVINTASDYDLVPLIYLKACDSTSDWPFELLAKADDDGFLLPGFLHLVRLLKDWGKSEKPKMQPGPLNLLFTASAPTDIKPELDYHLEEEILIRATEIGTADIDCEDSGTLEGLGDKLAQHSYDVVHLSGHTGISGDMSPYLVMEDENGDHRNISPDQLWHEALYANRPRLLFLSGCNTARGYSQMSTGSFAERLVKKYNMPAVLGWGRPVDDYRAGLAQGIFYNELSRGMSILAALQRVRNQLEQESRKQREPGDEPPCLWPLLRLFCNRTPLDIPVVKKTKRERRAQSKLDTELQLKGHPFPKEGFVGRRRQLQQSVHALKTANSKAGIMILGTAGLGKSRLAVKTCNHLKDYTIILIRGQLDDTLLREALRKTFERKKDKKGLGCLKDKILNAGPEKHQWLIDICLHCFDKKKYLLLLDNFEENLEMVAVMNRFRLRPRVASLLKILVENLPYTGNMSKMIITSRYRFSLWDNDSDLVEERLETVWLTSFTGSERQKKAYALVKVTNCPMASAFSRLTEMGVGNPHLMESIAAVTGKAGYRNARQRLQEAVMEPVRFAANCGLHDILRSCDEILSQLLRPLSIYRRPVDTEGIRLVAEAVQVSNWESVLAVGMGFGMVEYNRKEQTYQVTPLLGGLLHKPLIDETGRLTADKAIKEIHLQGSAGWDRYAEVAHEAAYHYYLNICSQQDTMGNYNPQWAEELIFHALGCGREQEACEKGEALVEYLREHMLRFREAAEKGEWILAAIMKQRKPSTEADARLLSETARTLSHLNRYDKALAYYTTANEINRLQYGERHKNTAEGINNLGTVLRALNRHPEAVQCFEMALDILTEIHGEQHKEFALTINNLATSLKDSGRYEEAISNLEKAKAIMKNSQDRDDREIAVTLNNMGAVYEVSGNYKAAETHYMEAYDIDRRSLGESHPATASDLNNIGSLMASKKQYAKAVNYYLQALHIFKRLYGLLHLGTAATFSNLGEAYYQLKQKKDAQKVYQKAYDIFDTIAPDHPHKKELAQRLQEAARLVLK